MKRGHDEAVLDRFLAGEIFNSSEIWENLLILCDDLGSCFAGTPEEAEAARFLEAKLRDYGLDNVHAEPFECHGWNRGHARFTMTAPRRRALECLSMPMAAGGQAHHRSGSRSFRGL